MYAIRSYYGDRSGCPTNLTPKNSCTSRSCQFAPERTSWILGTWGASRETVTLRQTRQPDAAEHEHEEQHQYERDADQPELLREHGEDESYNFV